MLVNHGQVLHFAFLRKRDDLPSFTFRGPALSGMPHCRLRLLDFPETLTINNTFGCFLVQRGCNSCGSSAGREFQDNDRFTEIGLLYRQRITDRHFFAGFDFFAIDQHLAGFNGVAREGPGFKKARGPQPFINTQGLITVLRIA